MVDVQIGKSLANEGICGDTEMIGERGDLPVSATDVTFSAATGMVPLEPETREGDAQPSPTGPRRRLSGR